MVAHAVADGCCRPYRDFTDNAESRDRSSCAAATAWMPETLASDVFDILDHQSSGARLRQLACQYGDNGFFKDESGRWWFGESALLDWLHRRSQSLDHQTMRLHRWFEKEVFPPMRKKAELRGEAPPASNG